MPDQKSNILGKLNHIENDIEELKVLLASEAGLNKKNVSLKGMAKLLVSESELDKSIAKAKKSLLNGAYDDLHS